MTAGYDGLQPSDLPEFFHALQKATQPAILLLSVLLCCACAPNKPYVLAKPYVQAQHGDASSLSDYALSLIGVPYKYGGNTPDTGFDCSGYVGYVYRHALGINLPRSTDKISLAGQSVSQSDLRIGDLVFFNTLYREYSHVGIYLGDNTFIHAPSGRGSVRVENFLDDYWHHHYDGARRITLLP